MTVDIGYRQNIRSDLPKDNGKDVNELGMNSEFKEYWISWNKTAGRPILGPLKQAFVL